jgi:hypothetical protein
MDGTKGVVKEQAWNKIRVSLYVNLKLVFLLLLLINVCSVIWDIKNIFTSPLLYSHSRI